MKNAKTSNVYIFIALAFMFIMIIVLGLLYFSVKNELRNVSQNNTSTRPHIYKKGGMTQKYLNDIKEKDTENSSSSSDDSDIDNNNDDRDIEEKATSVEKSQFRMNDKLNNKNLPPPLNMFSLSPEALHIRDRAVVVDPLYPPLNRNSVSPHDNYRMVGYLVSEEAQDDSWQLFGRKINNTRSEFYVRPTNKNIDMKVPIQDNDFLSPRYRLRDIDSLPDTTRIDNPLFTSQNYKVIVNPNTNFDSFYF